MQEDTVNLDMCKYVHRRKYTEKRENSYEIKENTDSEENYLNNPMKTKNENNRTL